MSDHTLEEARRSWVASLRESNARYRALLLESGAPAALIEELEFFERPFDALVTRPVLPPHPDTAANAASCHDLLLALNELRSRFVDGAATHAAPGLGQEEMAFLHVEQTTHHGGLMAEIERLERAMMAAGCPV